ncbi:hypothetical protein [Actinomadura sp. 6N118]|uniref:hypothetical protein n=1 Tax=Actinomadura sp. 6N118 TaxID=3375151 RepID=UPI0037AF5A51
MLRAQLDTEISNKALKSGKLQEVVESMMDRLKPEAAYFGPSEGVRECTFVFDMQDSSSMPTLAEPLFQELGAKVEIHPVMNPEDLQKGLASLKKS